MQSHDLSVVVAVQQAEQNLPDILTALDPASHAGVEFIFCVPASGAGFPCDAAVHSNVSILRCARDSLIPALWKEGILAATADRVALTTAHCVPEPDWVKTLLAIDMTTTPAVGGVITNDRAANARSWAIYLLRYIPFSPPLPGAEVMEIAADNALYRRQDILRNADILEDGFWEPSFHKRFQQAGFPLVLNSRLRVIHRNCYTTRQFFEQRLAHGKAFGMSRCEDISDGKRRLLMLLSPLIPFVFLAKICLRVVKKRRYAGKLLRSFPWLLIFLTAWGLGEAKGYRAGAGLTRSINGAKQEHPES